jgi:hypothetical protein
MQHHSQPLPEDIRSALSGINSVINLLQAKLPMTSYVQALLAVARHEKRVGRLLREDMRLQFRRDEQKIIGVGCDLVARSSQSGLWPVGKSL